MIDDLSRILIGPLLLLALILMVIGVLNIYSATIQTDEGLGPPSILNKSIGPGSGLFLLLVVLFFDYHLLLSLAYPLYWISILLLIGVLVFGRAISGSQRWLTMASFSFQPSELVKISLILALAKYFSQNEVNHRYGFRDLYIPCGMVLLPALLIIKQPDLGTALLLMLVSISLISFPRNRMEDLVYFPGKRPRFLSLLSGFSLRIIKKNGSSFFSNRNRIP